MMGNPSDPGGSLSDVDFLQMRRNKMGAKKMKRVRKGFMSERGTHRERERERGPGCVWWLGNKTMLL